MKIQLCPKCKTALSKFNELSGNFFINNDLLKDLKRRRIGINTSLPVSFNCSNCKTESYKFDKNNKPPKTVLCRLCHKKKAVYKEDDDLLIVSADQIINLKVGSAVIQCPKCKTHYNLDILRTTGSDIEVKWQ